MVPRPHEDRERHTPTDHRAGGPIITFAPGSWWAIEVAHVAAERVQAGIASFETLIEKARHSAKAHEGVVLYSHNHRRVIALLGLDGHEAFRHLASAWDDHHLFAERHAVAESQSLALYKLSTAIGEAIVDPASTDVYAFERTLRTVEAVRTIASEIAAAPGFRSAALFTTDDDRAPVILYTFTHDAEIEAFVRRPRRSVLGTDRRDGRHLLPGARSAHVRVRVRCRPSISARQLRFPSMKCCGDWKPRLRV